MPDGDSRGRLQAVRATFGLTSWRAGRLDLRRVLQALHPLLFLTAIALVALAAPAAAGETEAWTAERMIEVPLPSDVAVAPGGAKVAWVEWRAVMTEETSEDRGRIWIGGESEATAISPEGVSASDPRWSPDGGSLAWLSPVDGREQIWLRRLAAPAARQITASAADVSDFRWLPDGRGLIFVAGSGDDPALVRARRSLDDAHELGAGIDNERLWRLDLAAAADGPAVATALTPPDSHVAADMGLSFGYLLSGFDVSPDGRHIAYTRTRSAAVADWPTADVVVLDLASGSIRAVAATPRAEGSPRFSPDGRLVAYTASGEPPTHSFAARVRLVATEGGAPRELAATLDERPRLVGWSGDGRSLYFSEVRGTVTRLSALPVDGSPPADLDGGDRVLTSIGLDSASGRFGFVAETTTLPPEVFLAASAPFAPRQVSDLAAGRRDPPIGKTILLRWPSTDGLEIEGLLTYPVGYRAGERVPLLLVVHGGPTYYFLQDYLATGSEYPLAAFAARGFAVLRVNPRGSSGRGRDFRFADRNDWGGGDYRDLMGGVDRVIEMGVADPARLGVMGWSYGGYMTAWIVTQTRRFRAASVGAGIADIASFSGTADIPDFAADYFDGPPWERTELYVERSPLFHLGAVTTPTLIQQGESDVRVPTSQGIELYRALRRLGVETRLVLYPRQGHEFHEPKMRLDAARRNLEWFERHLLGATP